MSEEQTEEEKEILRQTIIEDEEGTQENEKEQDKEDEKKLKSSLSEKLNEQKKAAKKKRYKILGALAGVAFIGFAVWYLIAPYNAGPKYGICRTLLELQLPYPHTLYVSELKPLRDRSIKLWYTHTDAFGEYRMESFTCKLQRNKETGAFEIVSLKMHKVFLEQEKIDALNGAMPYFAANPLVLTWPARLPDSLNDLHFDFDSVRKIKIAPKN